MAQSIKDAVLPLKQAAEDRARSTIVDLIDKMHADLAAVDNDVNKYVPIPSSGVGRKEYHIRQARRQFVESRTMADEVPRLTELFAKQRLGSLPQSHQQCSMQQPQAITNVLTCCLGVKTLECKELLALEKMIRVDPADIDAAKAWTCVGHIASRGATSCTKATSHQPQIECSGTAPTKTWQASSTTTPKPIQSNPRN